MLEGCWQNIGRMLKGFSKDVGRIFQNVDRILNGSKLKVSMVLS